MKTKITLSILAVALMFSTTAFAQNVRGYYLQHVGNWLGDTAAENEILRYTQGNGFNYILFYDLGQINWTSAIQKNQLGAFISKARSQYGVIQIGGVVEYAGYVTQYLLPYNNSRANMIEKFDVINLEFEFWLSASASSYYCNKFLSAAGYSCDLNGSWQFAWREFQKIDSLCAANSLMSEIYLGWPTQAQMQLLASRADRILLTAYRQHDGDIYAYSKPRLMDIASTGTSTKVMTLLSSEPDFMGPWLATHQQTQPFQSLQTSLNAETQSFRQNIDLQGYQWFTYQMMPKTILGGANITSSGPLSICQGSSVTLTANTGTSYLWSPGGQTTRSINVTNAGNYSVRVTNSNGVQFSSAPVQVSVTIGNTLPTVSLSGSPTFCPGSFVTLTSSPSSNYQWSNGATTQSITVTTSGTYSVTTGMGSCMASSAPVVVNAASTPITPVITASGSLSVCPGTLLTLTSSPSNGYLWSNGATTRSIVVSSPGNYTVKAFTGPNCFAQSAQKKVTNLPAPPKPVITASGSTTLTSLNPIVTLTAPLANGYLWSSGETTRAITVSYQGSYRVTTMGANGCTALSNPVNIIANGCTPPAIPTITASGPTVITSGQSVTLTSSVSGGYLWSTGEQTQSITVTTPGIYSVRSYNRGGCFSTSLPTTVTVVLAKRKAVEIAEEKPAVEFNVYPNPVKETLNITFHSEVETKSVVSLIDITGRELESRSIPVSIGENKVEMNVSSLPPGIYFANLTSGNERQVKKIIVE